MCFFSLHWVHKCKMSMYMPWCHMEYSPKDRCMWSVLPASHSTPGRSSRYPLNKMLVGAHGWCWHFGKRKSRPRGMDLTMIPWLSTLWPGHHTAQGVNVFSTRVTVHPSQEKGHLPLIDHKKRTSICLRNAQTNKKYHLQNVIFQVLEQAHFSVASVFCRRAGTPQT
jgi:hypothetical protein